MRREEVIEKLMANGCIFLKVSPRHFVFQNIWTGATQPVPRNYVLNDTLANRILQKMISDQELTADSGR